MATTTQNSSSRFPVDIKNQSKVVVDQTRTAANSLAEAAGAINE